VWHRLRLLDDLSRIDLNLAAASGDEDIHRFLGRRLLRRIAMMSSVSKTLPWQLEPVSSLGTITAGALVALAVDVLFARQVSPTALIPLGVACGLLFIAVRVMRGFGGSLPAAVAAFVATGLGAAAALEIGAPAGGAGRSALVVAVVLATFGSGAALAAWVERRRRVQPVIEITRPLPERLAPARIRPRVYR
jgi:hypothetical protein